MTIGVDRSLAVESPLAYQTTNDLTISSSNPILASHIASLARNTNYFWGRGQQLIPQFTVPTTWCKLSSSTEYLIALRILPKKQSLERNWQLTLSNSLGMGPGANQLDYTKVMFKIIEPHGTNGTQRILWTAGDPTLASFQDVFQPEKYTSSGSYITASVSHSLGSPSQVFYLGLGCFEHPRHFAYPKEWIRNPDRDIGSVNKVINSGTFMNTIVPDNYTPGYPLIGAEVLSDGTDYPKVSGPYPVAASISGSALLGMRKAGQFCVAVPYSNKGVTTPEFSFWTISGSANQVLFNGRKIPVSLRHLYGPPTGNNTFSSASIAFFFIGSLAGTSGVLMLTGSGGRTLELPISSSTTNTGSWITCSLMIKAEDPTNSLPWSYQGDQDTGWFIVSGSRKSTGGTISFTTIHVGEPGSNIL